MLLGMDSVIYFALAFFPEKKYLQMNATTEIPFLLTLQSGVDLYSTDT
jgi:hypothetical protein